MRTARVMTLSQRPHAGVVAATPQGTTPRGRLPPTSFDESTGVAYESRYEQVGIGGVREVAMRRPELIQYHGKGTHGNRAQE